MVNEPNEQSTFFLAFVGQKITITTNVVCSASFDAENMHTVPLYFEGILLDYDEEYYYLGDSPNEITSAVRRSETIHIMANEEKDVYTQMLESLPEPNKKEEIN